MANTSTLGLPKPEASNRLVDDVERIKTSFDGFDAAIAARATQNQLTAHTGNQQNPHATTATQTGAIPAASDSVTDGYIGTRTLDPSQTATSNAGNLTALLSAIAGRIRAIMGTTNWYDSPPISLQGAQTHIGNTGNPHGTTAVQVGAIPASGGSVNDTYIGSRTANIALAPSAQSSNGVELTTWLGWIINRIRAITGTTNWFDTPATTLSGAASHHSNTGNPHNTTAAQVATASGYGSGAWGISISGNAATATTAARLTTARTINGVSFDGSANVAIPMVKSLRRSTITLGINETTKTYTINPSVDITKTFVSHLGVTVLGLGQPSIANATVSLTLTNATTLTATRVDDGVAATVSFEIIESY